MKEYMNIIYSQLGIVGLGRAESYINNLSIFQSSCTYSLSLVPFNFWFLHSYLLSIVLYMSLWFGHDMDGNLIPLFLTEVNSFIHSFIHCYSFFYILALNSQLPSIIAPKRYYLYYFLRITK